MAAPQPDVDKLAGEPADKAIGKAAGRAQESQDLFESILIEDQIPGDRPHSAAWVEIPYDDPSLLIAQTLYPPRARRSALDAPGLWLALGALVVAAGSIGLFMLVRGRVPSSGASGTSVPGSTIEAPAPQVAAELPVLSSPSPSASAADTLSRTEARSLDGQLPIVPPGAASPSSDRPATASPVPERPAPASPARDRPVPAVTERPAPQRPARETPPQNAPRGVTGTGSASTQRVPPASEPRRSVPGTAAAAPQLRAVPAEATAVPAAPPAPEPTAPAAPAPPAPQTLQPPQMAPAPAPGAAPQAPQASAAAAALSPTGAAAAPTPASAELSLAADERGVRGVIERYRAAYSALDVGAVHAVWPKVNARALGRAFGQLATQHIEFAGCEISIAGERASAGCSGNAEFVTKVGSRTPRLEARTWSFELRKTGSQWIIEAVESR